MRETSSWLAHLAFVISSRRSPVLIFSCWFLIGHLTRFYRKIQIEQVKERDVGLSGLIQRYNSCLAMNIAFLAKYHHCDSRQLGSKKPGTKPCKISHKANILPIVIYSGMHPRVVPGNQKIFKNKKTNKSL